MELILISNTKLKIMLNESDMKKYHIGSESDCAQSSTRRAIRTLLECAKDQIGFNTDGEEIFVQLYTSKKGGCELFVTKCLSEAPSDEIYERIKSPIVSEENSYEKRQKKQGSLPERPSEQGTLLSLSEKNENRLPLPRERHPSRVAYSFSNMSDMLDVCKILSASDIRTESKAFSDDDGNYYLLLLDTGMSAYSRLDRLTFIIEYGRRENPDCLVSYISEHGKTICDGRAVETLGRL